MHLKVFEGVFADNFNALIKVADGWPGYEKIVQKLKNIQGDFLRRFGENAEPAPNELKVLNHGDLWVNNFMFRYNTEFSKHPNDLVFVSFLNEAQFHSNNEMHLSLLHFRSIFKEASSPVLE